MAFKPAWDRLLRLDPAFADALLAIVMTVCAIGQILVQEPQNAIRLVPVAGTTVPLAWRRRAPLLCYSVQFAAALLTLEPPTFAGLLALFIGIYSIGAHSHWRLRSLAAPLLSAVILQVLFPDSSPPLSAGATTLVVGLATWLAGNAIRDRQARADALEERSQRLEREQALAAQVAVAQERARIARELHDVVAHSVGLMVVQAGAARLQVGSSPGQAVDALRSIESTGREALGELRRMLGLLTDQQEAPSLSPAPGLAQLEELAARVRAAGVPVTLHVEGSPRPVPPGLDLTAYRLIQEALTNVLKHAGGARTDVVVAYDERELRVEVVDEGAGVQADAGSRVNGAQHGIVGMRERVALYGGRLETGPRPEGGYAMRARLPLEST
jgi:signal transduction histidine kinase